MKIFDYFSEIVVLAGVYQLGSETITLYEDTHAKKSEELGLGWVMETPFTWSLGGLSQEGTHLYSNDLMHMKWKPL